MTQAQNHQEIFPVWINELEYSFTIAVVTGRQILEKANLLPIDCHELFQEKEGRELRRIWPEEEINVSHHHSNHFVTKEPDIFHYTVDNKNFTSDKAIVTPLEILRNIAINPHERYLVQILSDGQQIIYAYDLQEHIRLRCPGLTFMTKEWLEQVDIEEYGKQCKPVPPAHRYKIKIDKNYYIIEKPWILLTDILQLEKKSPVDKFDVYAFFSNNPKPTKLSAEEKFYVVQKCFVRFVIQPKEQQDGRELRRQFNLPEEDIQYLNQTDYCWETLNSGGYWLIINKYPLPIGYQIETADIALCIPPNYPATEIDMVYFYPDLRKLSGSTIRATAAQNIDGKLFQRWSRHRKAGEWRPGVDDISTHLVLVDQWLLNELNR